MLIGRVKVAGQLTLGWKDCPGLYWRAQYTGGPSVISEWDREAEGSEPGRDLKILHWWHGRWRKGPQAKECRPTVEAAKDQDTESLP